MLLVSHPLPPHTHHPIWSGIYLSYLFHPQCVEKSFWKAPASRVSFAFASISFSSLQSCFADLIPSFLYGMFILFSVFCCLPLKLSSIIQGTCVMLAWISVRVHIFRIMELIHVCLCLNLWNFLSLWVFCLWEMVCYYSPSLMWFVYYHSSVCKY